MDSVGSLHGVFVGSDGEDVVVVTLLDRTALVLTSLGRGLVVGTPAQGTLTSTIELADSAGNLGVGALAGLGVVVAENTSLPDVLGSEVITAVVLGEGLERSVAVLVLTNVPLGHTTTDLAVGVKLLGTISWYIAKRRSMLVWWSQKMGSNEEMSR